MNFDDVIAAIQANLADAKTISVELMADSICVRLVILNIGRGNIHIGDNAAIAVYALVAEVIKSVRLANAAQPATVRVSYALRFFTRFGRRTGGWL